MAAAKALAVVSVNPGALNIPVGCWPRIRVVGIAENTGVASGLFEQFHIINLR